MATVLAKVGLQRLQPILDAQEVDLPALLELDNEVWLFYNYFYEIGDGLTD